MRIVFILLAIIGIALMINKIHGGLDTRESLSKEGEILFWDEGKNIDILGKLVRRGRGQENKFTHSAGWLGFTEHEVQGVFKLRGIDDNGRYYRLKTIGGDFFSIGTTYDDKSFDVSEQGSGYGRSFVLSSDGTKMYLGQFGLSNIYQYTLTTPGDISTATYDNKSFYTGEHVGLPTNLFLSSDGTKLYMAGMDTASIHRYTLSTPWDITSCTDHKSKVMASPDADPRGVFLTPDGTKMYFLGVGISPVVYQYTLSIPGDITTATYDNKSKSVTTEDTDPLEIFFSSDGTKLYMLGMSTDTIYRYTLSTPWDVSSATYDNEGFYLDLGGMSRSMYIDETKLYVLSAGHKMIFQYTLSPSWDVSSTLSKSGLAGTSPYFFQFQSKLIVGTGGDDPFTDNGANIVQTGLYTARTVYGTCGVSYNGRIWIANNHTLYWSAANTTNDWTTAQDAGYKDDINGIIVALHKYQGNLYIFTTSDIYILSGYDPSDFRIDHYSNTGIFSEKSVVIFDEKLYVWANNGLYPIETLSEIAQITVKQGFTFRISNLFQEIDKDRLNEIILVPYNDRKQIWCYVPIENETGLYKAYIANFINTEDQLISFYTREALPITCVTNFKGKIYTGTSDGHIFLEDSGDKFNEDAIESELWFPVMSFGDSRIKKIKDFIAWFNPRSVNKFTWKYIIDGDEANPIEWSIDLTHRQNENKDRLSEFLPIMPDQFSTIKIGFSTTATDEDFELYGFEFIGLKAINGYNQI